jgi:HEAT repeat protein
MPLLRVCLILVLLPLAAHAYTDEERAEMEKQRIQQALENLATYKYEQQENAFYKFEQMGEEAVPHLVRLIRDEKSKKTAIVNGIHALGRLGETGKAGVPVIIPFLKSEDNDIRTVAVIALGKIGLAAKDAVPILATMQSDPDPWVSQNAQEALRKIPAPAAIEAVREFEAKQKKGK